MFGESGARKGLVEVIIRKAHNVLYRYVARNLLFSINLKEIANRTFLTSGTITFSSHKLLQASLVHSSLLNDP